ncbi:helix-turn-helix domain-containing protein [Pseudonocardia sp. WMMC193]|uniref:helix-turn-helix domain-containing protein n=1 Tax=Pseudonocardia sp. WMMC193 TaxID=2911965 RepID=UPI001F436629|nr:helix-turn-helix domain-containing protein [Pseudonocardia sp. WMMC193]MCF7552724.1 helix-turn-helix domain-containing protein [Pseudonocardia sp. WMMC193]
MASTWREARSRRRPNEEAVALHRAHLDEVVRAHQLKEIRTEQGVTQRELAERMNVTQPSVSAMERGELSRAGLGTIRAYVEALGGTVDVVANFGDQRVIIG